MQSSIGKPFEGQKGPLKERGRGCIKCVAESRRLWRTMEMEEYRLSCPPRELSCSIHGEEAATGDASSFSKWWRAASSAGASLLARL